MNSETLLVLLVAVMAGAMAFQSYMEYRKNAALDEGMDKIKAKLADFGITI